MAPVVLRRVALFGASGKIGKPILAALLKTEFEVTIIARASSKGVYDIPVTLKQVSDNYNQDEITTALEGQDAVIIAFAHAGNAHHRTIMDAAADAGVKHIVPNHWGSNAELSIIHEVSDRAKALDRDVDYLRQRQDRSSWTAIVPGIFFDSAFPNSLLGFNLQNKTVEVWDSGNATFSASTHDDIANATIAVLKNPEAVKNQYAYTSSFSTSQNQLLDVVQKLTGRTWTVKTVISAEKVKEARETIVNGAQGMPWLMAQGTLAASCLFGGEQYQADFDRAGRSANAVLGLKASNVVDSVAKLMP